MLRCGVLLPLPLRCWLFDAPLVLLLLLRFPVFELPLLPAESMALVTASTPGAWLLLIFPLLLIALEGLFAPRLPLLLLFDSIRFKGKRGDG